MLVVSNNFICRRTASSKISPPAPVQASRDSSAGPQDTHLDSRTNKPSDRDTDRHVDGRTDRRSDQDRSGHRDQKASKHDDIRGRDRRDSHTDRQQERARAAGRRPLVNPNSKQAELLAFAASDLNAFSNDGSFMEKFAAAQSAKEGAAAQGSPVNNEELELSGKCCRGNCYSDCNRDCYSDHDGDDDSDL